MVQYSSIHTATIISFVLYCIVSVHLYSASCRAHQSEALPVRETKGEESSLERTKRGTWPTMQLIKWIVSEEGALF